MSAAFYALANQRLDALGTTDADDDRAREHMADLVRTRIEPGADPREPWGFRAVGEGATERALFEFAYGDALPALWSAHDLLERRARPALAGDQYRYVPVDVARWRDPEHRADIERRAREYAALQPRGHR